ncbi:MAG: type II secretion system protein GspJ [Pseudomonadota bacterium]
MDPLLNKSGFTLLEVLLALAIFSMIALTTSNQINVIRNTKDTALAQIEQYDGIRSAIAVIRDDLGQAFHKRYPDLGGDLQRRVQRSEPAPHTLFDGRSNQLIFTSLSHRNFYATRKDGQQAEISYFLQPSNRNGFTTLMKRESPLIDGNLFEGGSLYTLLDEVSVLEFRYWDDKLLKWSEDWNSDAGVTRDNFPRAVKLRLATVDPKSKKEVTIETTFKIGFPNNTNYVVTLP